MAETTGTRPLSWYDAPPDYEEETDDEREEREEREEIYHARLRKIVRGVKNA